MNRTDLSFLEPMFEKNNLANYHILVINQTHKQKLLTSTLPNIRVINSRDFGLSKSRNLAIKNSSKEICLIADDDVVFLENLAIKVIGKYNLHEKADVIIFQTITTKGQSYRNYPLGNLKKKQLKDALSIEISFKTKFLKKHNITFNELFGLGAKFSDTENVHFLNDLADHNAKIIGVKDAIVNHQPYSSSDDIASESLMYARGASFYKRFGVFAYLYVIKYGYFLLRKNYITINQLKPKMQAMLKGIADYKSL